MMAVGMERRELQRLEVHDSNCKLWQVDEHIIGFSAGIVVDAKSLMKKCMVEAISWRMQYEECPTVGHIARFLSAFTSDNVLNNKARPMGCSIILGGCDIMGESENNPHPKEYPVPRLYMIDPSGALREFKSYAIGRFADIVNDFLKAEHDHFQELLAKVAPEDEERLVCEFVLSAIMQVMAVGKENIEVITIKNYAGARILSDFETQTLANSLRANVDAEKLIIKDIKQKRRQEEMLSYEREDPDDVRKKEEKAKKRRDALRRGEDQYAEDDSDFYDWDEVCKFGERYVYDPDKMDGPLAKKQKEEIRVAHLRELSLKDKRIKDRERRKDEGEDVSSSTKEEEDDADAGPFKQSGVTKA